MSATRSQAAIREELQLVEEDLTSLRETAASLRQRIGERADEPTDQAERAATIESADEQDALIAQLQARRERLLAELGGRSFGPGRKSSR
jgi:F0F1-type ATP synthase membrane subunit b/b'